MNFLLHRHLAARSLGAAAGHGAMLPDLWRMADRRVRAQALPPDGADDDGLAAGAADDRARLDREVAAGIAHHLQADLWFHRSELFREGEAVTAARFRAAALTAPRMGLLAHAAWELSLDGALVRREGAEGQLAALSRGHALAGEGPARRAAERHHFARVERTADERVTFEAHMAEIDGRLLEGRWVRAYASGAGLSAVIDGMRRRLGLATLSPRDGQALAEVMEAMLERADGLLGQLLEGAP